MEKRGTDHVFFKKKRGLSPFFLLVVLLLQACTSYSPKPPKKIEPSKGGISSVDVPPDWDIRDGTPTRLLNPNNIADAVPQRDVIRGAGNKSPYTVLGETYQIMPTGRGFRQRGMGSWYGTKFHGRKTSNGEDYDVYSMTAAHKTLPIPCYVRVTNLENGRKAVVRVNDRGPFLHNRIIDLSYAAATKLGYANKGTALLEIEYIDTNNLVDASFKVAPMAPPLKPTPYAGPVRPVSQPVRSSPAPSSSTSPSAPSSSPSPSYTANPAQQYLQAGAFGNFDAARQLAEKLQRQLNRPVFVNSDKPKLYRVHVGPIPVRQVEAVRAQLAAVNIHNAHPVRQ
jgi:rare lipoprotein A